MTEAKKPLSPPLRQPIAGSLSKPRSKANKGSGSSSSSSSQVPILVINGIEISKQYFLSELLLLSQPFQKKKTKPLSFLHKKKVINKVKENIIFQTLLEEHAMQEEEAIPFEEIEKNYKKIVEHFGGEQTFHKHFQELESTDRKAFSVMQKVEKSLKTQNLINHWAAELPNPNEEALHKFFKDNPEFYNSPQSLKLSAVLGKGKISDFNESNDPVLYALETLKQNYEANFDLQEFFSLARKVPFLEVRQGFSAPKASLPQKLDHLLWNLAPMTLSPNITYQDRHALFLVEDFLPAKEGDFSKLKQHVLRDYSTAAKNSLVRSKLQALKQKALIQDNGDQFSDELLGQLQANLNS